MGVPKRRKPKAKIGMRRGSGAHKKALPAGRKCPQCGGDKQSHRVCPACGYYAGRQVITVSAED